MPWAARPTAGRCRRWATATSTSSSSWRARRGQVIVKQALPYVRLVGESWPLPLRRAFFEYHALIRQEARDPGIVPRVMHFDEGRRSS
jgi:S-methyl-5-thioribose kinase